MKKLLVLLFSLLISFNTYGEWILVSGDHIADGYIETDTIKETNGYVYFWLLQNRHTPDEEELMSIKLYGQGDCGIDRIKFLAAYGYKVPMAKGEIEKEEIVDFPKWTFQAPDSIGGILLNYVCDYVK